MTDEPELLNNCPFTHGECQVFNETIFGHADECDGAAVFSADGQPFCLIDPDTCVGGKEGALERARVIAEALNRQA
jgi:hypothetical protein